MIELDPFTRLYSKPKATATERELAEIGTLWGKLNGRADNQTPAVRRSYAFTIVTPIASLLSGETIATFEAVILSLPQASAHSRHPFWHSVYSQTWTVRALLLVAHQSATQTSSCLRSRTLSGNVPLTDWDIRSFQRTTSAAAVLLQS